MGALATPGVGEPGEYDPEVDGGEAGGEGAVHHLRVSPGSRDGPVPHCAPRYHEVDVTLPAYPETSSRGSSPGPARYSARGMGALRADDVATLAGTHD
ncbi:hypothetical protein Jiend_30820 [Micromonospora endophytica]|nr:hypothetical protein Jiend_30820 [Micromonospora endophytica]